METVQRSWARVLVDDVEQFADILEPDRVLQFDANNRIQITAANAAAIRLTINGQVQLPFGTRGQQADVDITTSGVTIVLKGEVSPTPSPTIGSTNTPEAVATTTLNLITESPTAVQVNGIGQPAGSDSQASVQATSALPTPTSIFEIPATPEPQQPTPTLGLDLAITNTEAQTVVEHTPTPVLPTAIPPTATITPTASPTATTAVLPLRATSANPTATKSG
jgi:hypothetical protein